MNGWMSAIYDSISRICKKQKRLFVALSVGLLSMAGIPVAFVEGYISQVLKYINDESRVNHDFFFNVRLGFTERTGRTAAFTMILMAAGLYILVRICRSCHSKDNRPYPGKDGISQTTGNRSEFERESFNEIGSHFNISDINEARGIIVGYDSRSGLVYSQKEDNSTGGGTVIGVNSHIAVMGKSGSGKTFSFIIPLIYQCIKSGYSLFVTDPAGELYHSTSAVAREMGYTVKAFIIRGPEEFVYSDAFNPIHNINGNPLRAAEIADIIISNGTRTDTVWSEFAKPLLAFLILYVDGLAGSDKRNRESFYEICNLGRVKDILERGCDGILRIIAGLSKDHPGYGFAMDFKNSPETRNGAIRNASQSLNLFSSREVRRITTGHDMDMSRPADERCIYYIVTDVQHESFHFLASLFYDAAFTELKMKAQENSTGRLRHKVKFLLEEFASIGYIPGMDRIMQNYRKYNIDIILCLQYYGQLFEKGYSAGLLDAADTLIFMGSNSADTTRYISERIGGGDEEAQTLLTKLNRGTDSNLRELIVSYRCPSIICNSFPAWMHPYYSLNIPRESIGDRIKYTQPNDEKYRQL